MRIDKAAGRQGHMNLQSVLLRQESDATAGSADCRAVAQLGFGSFRRARFLKGLRSHNRWQPLLATRTRPRVLQLSHTRAAFIPF